MSAEQLRVKLARIDDSLATLNTSGPSYVYRNAQAERDVVERSLRIAEGEL